MKSPLSKHHQQSYDAIFQHPIAHDLDRRQVVAMLGEVASVNEEPNGNLKIARNGQTLFLHASPDRTISNTDELMSIRHFLQRLETPPATEPSDPGNFLVVIDHREARIFKAELHGEIPQRITPFDPHGYGRTLHHVEDDATGQRKPELKSFYDAIAKTLSSAASILIFGSGTGASSAMEQLLAMLQQHHPEIAKRVIDSVTIEAQHLSEDQLLARAREVYENRKPSVLPK